MPRFDADWIESMLQPHRRGSPPADEILAYLEMAPGMSVADVGCGPGFLTLPAASRVGPMGRVYAVDLEPAMLDLVARRAKEAGIGQIETRGTSGGSLPLGDGAVDLTLCSLVLHDLDDPPSLMRELDRITGPTGQIAIIEWTPAPDDKRPNRFQPSVIATLLRDVGREPGATIQLGNAHYLIVGQASN